MKILVFSDSHSQSGNIKMAIDLHKNDTDLVIFLGDGVNDLYSIRSIYPEIPFFVVKGNCDFYCQDVCGESVLNLDGIRVLVTHGHLYSAKSSYTFLARHAAELEADAVFFGHTHIPYDDIIEAGNSRIQIFNPGSIGYGGSYGIVHTSGKTLVTSHGKIY